MLPAKLDEVSLAVHRDACTAARKRLDQLAATEASQPSVTFTERTTRCSLLAAAQKRLDLAHDDVRKLPVPHEGWRWEEIRQSLRAWDQRKLSVNPHPTAKNEFVKPLIGLTLAHKGYNILIRGDADRLRGLNDQTALMELQRALALLFVLRRALLAACGLREEAFDCLIFGNERARSVLQPMWRTLLTHHGKLWRSEVGGVLPAHGKPLYELPEEAPIHLRLPTPFCNLPLINPDTGIRIELLTALGDPRNIAHPQECIVRLRQALSAPDIQAALYDLAPPEPAPVPSPPS